VKWSQPVESSAPGPAPTTVEVASALLTRVDHGALRTYGQSRRFIRGAVYSGDGRLVPESQKLAPPGYPWVHADADRAKPPARSVPLSGNWLYGGHWAQHFGHFLIETMPTLWPSVGQLDGIVFHKYLRRPWSVTEWQRELLGALGLADLPIEVVDRRPYLVERLVVPSRAVVPNAFVHPEALAVWQRIRAPYVDTTSTNRLYLSRTRHNAETRASGKGRPPRTSKTRDLELDATFGHAGFEVCFPEQLSLSHQFRLVANADVIAGLSGSALHMTAVAKPDVHVIEVGDRRSANRPSSMQVAIDRAYRRNTKFFEHSTTARSLGRGVASLLRHVDR